MPPPFISYITFNRLGLTIKSLSSILENDEDFELHIIDCNSHDDTWDYIMSLNDRRIKTKELFENNHGKVYATNLHLTRRRQDQYFFSVDQAVSIDTKRWIGKFIRVFEAFPNVGLLGAAIENEFEPQVITQTKGYVSYRELCGDMGAIEKNHIPDYCMCLHPRLIKEIGYFSEENYFGPIELSYRLMNHTTFKAGFVPDVHIQLDKSIACNDCVYSEKCPLDKTNGTCFSLYNKYVHDEEFFKKNKWKLTETIRDMKNGTRPVYCASIHDVMSVSNHIYNKDWALGNMEYYYKNAN